ncbi:hypothetical protein [Glycomyces tritici]|uniref:hypothetical protein n=1 Tax=Glycomyces tritici TaxID=2665176 RepID=UPI0033906BBF
MRIAVSKAARSVNGIGADGGSTPGKCRLSRSAAPFACAGRPAAACSAAANRRLSRSSPAVPSRPIPSAPNPPGAAWRAAMSIRVA